MRTWPKRPRWWTRARKRRMTYSAMARRIRAGPAIPISLPNRINHHLSTNTSALTAWSGALRNPFLTVGALIGAATVRERYSSGGHFLAVTLLVPRQNHPQSILYRYKYR